MSTHISQMRADNLLLFVLTTLGLVLVMVSSSVEWFEWNVVVAEVEGPVQSRQITITQLPWKTKPGEDWTSFSARSHGLQIDSLRDQVCGKDIEILVERSARDQLIQQLADQTTQGMIWPSMVISGIIILYVAWSMLHLYRKTRADAVVLLGAMIGYCIVLTVILAFLGPSTSTGIPSWFVMPVDPTCTGQITLRAELRNLRPEGVGTFVSGIILNTVSLALLVRKWHGAKLNLAHTPTK